MTINRTTVRNKVLINADNFKRDNYSDHFCGHIGDVYVQVTKQGLVHLSVDGVYDHLDGFKSLYDHLVRSKHNRIAAEFVNKDVAYVGGLPHE